MAAPVSNSRTTFRAEINQRSAPNMAADDDFFSPRNTDTYEPCADDSNIAQGSVVLPIGAALSVLCYLYLMWMYFVLQSPIFKRHPTSKFLNALIKKYIVLFAFYFYCSTCGIQMYDRADFHPAIFVDAINWKPKVF